MQLLKRMEYLYQVDLEKIKKHIVNVVMDNLRWVLFCHTPFFIVLTSWETDERKLDKEVLLQGGVQKSHRIHLLRRGGVPPFLLAFIRFLTKSLN